MRKRWVLGAFSGFFFGLALSVILLGLHVVRLNSIWLTLLPVIFLLLGIVLGLWGPRQPRARTPVPVGAPPTASDVFEPPAPTPPVPSGEPTPPPDAPPTLSGNGDSVPPGEDAEDPPAAT